MAAEPKEYKDYIQNNLRIGDVAPNFTAQTTNGEIDFYNYLNGNWGILFSHPADFTPVCTTELGRVQHLKPEFEKRHVRVIALSVDSLENHTKWIQDINEINNCKLDYPIIADTDRRVAVLYGMLDQTYLSAKGLPLTVRSVYIVDPEKKIRLIITYPASTGRNFDEIIRVIDSLQLANSHKVATPADWKKGQDTVVLASVSTEEAQKTFPSVNVIRPWLRIVPDPSAK